MDERTERLPGGTRVFTGCGCGADALFLAHFSALRRGRVLDIGTGCGILPLALYDAGFTGSFTGLELDGEAAARAQRAAQENGLQSFAVVCGDARDYRADVRFDAAVCNPPYFSAGKRSPDASRRTARHDDTLTAADAARTAARCLKEGAHFYLCYTPARLAGLFAALAQNAFAVKRLRFVRERVGDPAWLALADAVYRGGEGLRVLPDLIVRAENGEYTKEAAGILAAGGGGHA